MAFISDDPQSVVRDHYNEVAAEYVGQFLRMGYPAPGPVSVAVEPERIGWTVMLKSGHVDVDVRLSHDPHDDDYVRRILSRLLSELLGRLEELGRR